MEKDRSTCRGNCVDTLQEKSFRYSIFCVDTYSLLYLQNITFPQIYIIGLFECSAQREDSPPPGRKDTQLQMEKVRIRNGQTTYYKELLVRNIDCGKDI